MGVFNDNITSNPITADFLRNIIKCRYSYENDSIEEICDKILNKIYRKVEYSVDNDIYTHKTTLRALNINSPFSDQAADKCNAIIDNHQLIDDIVECILLIKSEMGGAFWDEKFLKFKNFFSSRGFKVYFNIKEYIIKRYDPEKVNSRLITISWEDSEQKI